MCGIAVVYTATEPQDADEATVARMSVRLRHRGPDGIARRRVGRSWLGHTRLAIVDVAEGAQPLHDHTAQRWLVCNGEIYNHVELRRKLAERPGTHSDNEAALHLIAEHGPAGLSQLQGMFALCYADTAGAFVAARDLLGIKPLYWARDGVRVVFASELGAFDPELRGAVETFPPGHYWTPEGGLVRFSALPAPTEEYISRAGARSAIRATLQRAVRRRMMADVGVGVYLSGGLDSSIVAAIMARTVQDTGAGPVHSFAAGVADSPDLAAARIVADHLGLVHHERVYTADDVLTVLPTVVASMESYEPSLVHSAVPNYLLSELAGEYVKVVLTGEGADELFAGYHRLRAITDAGALRAELVRSIEGLHDLNLQRCDRVSMAHGVEARVPFLDLDVIEVAQRVPIEWKLPGEVGQEKRLLREAFEGWLPDAILWRVKAQFGDGSGTSAVMAERAEQLVPEKDWRSGIRDYPPPRSREELGYQRMFHRDLAGVRPERVLGRVPSG